MEEPEKLTLNLLMHEIRRERKCSRRHAYRIAHVVLAELVALDHSDALRARRDKRHNEIEWNDNLQVVVSWIE